MSPLDESSPRSSETEIPDNMLSREIRIGGQNKRKRDGSFRKLAGSPIEDHQSQNDNDDDDENDNSNNNNDVAFVLEESGELRDDVSEYLLLIIDCCCCYDRKIERYAQNLLCCMIMSGRFGCQVGLGLRRHILPWADQTMPIGFYEVTVQVQRVPQSPSGC